MNIRNYLRGICLGEHIPRLGNFCWVEFNAGELSAGKENVLWGGRNFPGLGFPNVNYSGRGRLNPFDNILNFTSESNGNKESTEMSEIALQVPLDDFVRVFWKKTFSKDRLFSFVLLSLWLLNYACEGGDFPPPLFTLRFQFLSQGLKMNAMR